jgi:hypothetical protein
MKKVFVKKNEFGFSYQVEGNKGYYYFPNSVNSRDSLLLYLAGKYDDIDLQFVNQAGKPAKVYSFKSGKTSAIVDFDPASLIPFDNSDRMTETEKLEFLQSHCTPEINTDAEKIEADNERIKYYLNKVSDDVRMEYKKLLDERMTPEYLKQLCERHASTKFNLPAEVIFE